MRTLNPKVSLLNPKSIIISEAMDIRTRQGLLNAMAAKVGKRMDALLIPLDLLSCVSRTEFSDKKAYIRWPKRQLNMLEEGLVNLLVVGFGESGRKTNEEVEEIIEFLKSTWRILGITETIHHTCYAWVLFHQHEAMTDGDKIESYVSSSIKIAFVRILQDFETMTNATDEHPLALLGDETKKHLKNDATVFMPVLSQWHPQAVSVSASLWKQVALGRHYSSCTNSDNTLYELNLHPCCHTMSLYGPSHLNKLEDSIWERWIRRQKQGKSNRCIIKRGLQMTAYEKKVSIEVGKISMQQLTGTKIIFWDLREPFIENLYRPSEPLYVELSHCLLVMAENVKLPSSTSYIKFLLMEFLTWEMYGV
ncbi:hypothetical protein L1887_30542 [Cichorium endivia]|nr:hypothetical protein L1887_30541 [Cichorium endivia]KAI3502463.1 hypothetical protein L1887_30542 [Cichorium endivia]